MADRKSLKVLVKRSAAVAPGTWKTVVREVNEHVKLDPVFVEKLLSFVIRGSLRGHPAVLVGHTAHHRPRPVRTLSRE